MAVTKSMKTALLATAAMNMFGAVLFVPHFSFLRELYGLPNAGHPLYLWIIAIWIFFFGLCYLRLAMTGGRERLFLTIAAAGKLTFSALIIVYWLADELPLQAAAGSLFDLFFGLFFARYLWLTRHGED